MENDASAHFSISDLTQRFAANFSALCRSIFPPKSPYSSSAVMSCSASSDDHHSTTAMSAIAMEHRARLVLEYQQLRDPCDLLRRAYDLTEETDLLVQLRLANSELAMQSCFRRLGLSDANSMGSDFSSEGVCNYRPASVVEQSGYETTNPKRVWLPKIPSSGYLRLNQAAASYSRSSRQPGSRLRMPRAQEPTKVQQRQYLPGGKREQEALEFEVSGQGMFEMELGNKWQETGTCPCGDHYQFAHGIGHPHDGTEVFRMVLAGDTCPYGHSYHFHSSRTTTQKDNEDGKRSEYVTFSSRSNPEKEVDNLEDEEEEDDEEENMATEEEEEDDDDDDDEEEDGATEEEEEDGDGNGRVFKIINVLNQSIEDEIASLKLSEFSDYGPFVQAIHAEWVKITGRTPQPEVDIVKPWPNFDTLYCECDADGSPIEIQVKKLRWEEFRKVASCVRMFHIPVSIYLIEDNQAKKAVGEADLRPLGSYEDLAHVLHLEWARYRGRNPNPNGVDIGSSWPGYRITLFGWEDPISTAMVWEEFKCALCFIRVKMMVGGPSVDEENMETTEKKTVFFEICKVSRIEHLDEAPSEEVIASLSLDQFSAYDSFAEAVHTDWMNLLSRPRVSGIDQENPWPHFIATYRGANRRPIDTTALSWGDFKQIATSVTMEEEGVSIYLALPFPSSQLKQISEVGRVYVVELTSYKDLARALHKAWAQYTGRNASPNVVDVEYSWPGHRVTLFSQDDSGLCNHPIRISNMDWVEFTETLYSIQVEPTKEMDSSIDDEFEDYGEHEGGGGNGRGTGE